MKNYIVINGQKTELTDKMLEAMKPFMPAKEMKLADVAVGSVVKIGAREMLVLDQTGDTTLVITKDLYIGASEFGSSNNFVGSLVAEHCDKFAGEIAEEVGDENIVSHGLDLTSDDGLKDYGTVECKASLLTADMYRKYVDILDTVNPKKYWWLATPYSTKRHENDSWVKCVAPSGFITYGDNYFNDNGVRPFCILKSTIFVSG